MSNNFFKTVRDTFLFAIPVVAGEISQVLFGIGDAIVAGRYSMVVLSALGIACAFLFPFLVFGIALISVVSPLKARRMGKGVDVKTVPSTALALATLIGSLLTVGVLITSLYIVPLFNYSPEIEPLIQQYLNICAFSVPPALMFAAIKENLLAKSLTFIPNLIIFGFNFFNVAVNIVLMFHFGLGIVGAALATLLSRLLMALFLYIYSTKKIEWHWQICWATFKRILQLGAPVGCCSLAVALVFAVVAMMIGKISIVASATNNVIINITSFTYMIPLSFSNVVAVKVGHAYGKKDMQLVKDTTRAGLFITVAIAILCAVVFFAIPSGVVQIFTNEPDVIAYGTGVLFFVALYQLPDAIQAVLCGSLRGLGKANVPFIMSVISVWFIGLPTGCYFAYSRNMEAAGLWAGLLTGLTALSIFLTGYYIKQMRTLNK